MGPDIIAQLKLVFSIILAAIEIGKSINDLLPELQMMMQLFGGTPLSPEQQKQLDDRHAALIAAATAPLPEPPEDAT